MKLKIAFLILWLSLPAVAFAGPQDFKPAWWCRGGHCQTIFAGIFRPNPQVVLERNRLNTPDGDFLDLDYLAGAPGAPTVVILHGLGSSSDAPYVQTLLEEIERMGWRAVVVNARGATGPNRKVETTHAGKSEDLDFVIQTLAEIPAAGEIYLVGYSLGGNVLLKWLGEKGAGVPVQVKTAVAVSVPYDLAKAADNLDHGFNKQVYTRNLLSVLKEQAYEKAERFPGSVDLEKVKAADTFTAYDREVTARLNGFKDEREYWAQSSAAGYLEGIERPVLLIHAANDPFLPERDLPIAIIQKKPLLRLLLASDGGHLGFISGPSPFSQTRWLEKTIMAYLSERDLASAGA